ncbi:MAG: LacI family DNA-binding transcriptional regulator, partial [Planctomycetes bacterium]|nr:LacI family DNA-binding transcriptional regulator [Planctomycetota bacterium]
IEYLVERLAQCRPKPDGLFIPYDFATALAYPVLQKAGIIPGEDIQVISVNNEESCLAGLKPRPATIDIQMESMSRHAVELLLWKVAHPEEASRTQVVVEPELVLD